MKNGNEKSESKSPETGDMNAPNAVEKTTESGHEAAEGKSAKIKGEGGRYVQPFWMDLLAIIGVYIVTSFVSWLVSYIITRSTHADQSLTVFIATLIQYPAVIVFAVWLLRKRGMKKPVLSFSLRRSDPTMILWGLLVIVAVSVVIEPLLLIFPAENMDLMRQYVLQGGALTMFTVVILAPILEEMLFRGIVQESTSRFYGPLAGILIASAIFAIVHPNPQQIVNAFFSGLILGYIYYRTRSLIPVIVIHAVNNAIAYILIHQFPQSAIFTMRQLMSNDTWYWIVYGISVALLLTAAANLWSQLKKRDRAEADSAK